MDNTDLIILAAASFFGAMLGGIAGLALMRLIVFLRDGRSGTERHVPDISNFPPPPKPRTPSSGVDSGHF
jgi:hypothetical protein